MAAGIRIAGLLAAVMAAAQPPVVAAQAPTARRTADVDEAAWQVVLRGEFSQAGRFEHLWQCSPGVHLLAQRGEVQLGPTTVAREAAAELISRRVNCRFARAGELRVAVGWRGVEAGETLTVEALASTGRWETLERIAADGADRYPPVIHVMRLPGDSLWGGLRLRFRAEVNDSDDRWLLRDVELRVVEPEVRLEIETRPALDAELQAVALADGRQFVLSVPGDRGFRSGTRLYLLPPPSLAGLSFSHWIIGDNERTDHSRGLRITLARSMRLTLVYRIPEPGHPETVVSLHTSPNVPARLLMGAGLAGAYLPVPADGAVPCLLGENLTALAPLRTDRHVFNRWVVNGHPMPRGGNVLRHQVVGTDVLIAEYALLGDMNDDGVLDKYDVDTFLLALVDPEAYQQRFPHLDRVRRGDINGDGQLDVLDVEPFVDLVLEE